MHIIRFGGKGVDTWTYIVPSLWVMKWHLLPSLPFHDVEALQGACRWLHWPCVRRGDGALEVRCPHSLCLRFTRSTAGMWHLAEDLPARHLTGKQWSQVVYLAHAYALAYLRLEAQRYVWSLTEVTRPDGSMAMIYSYGPPTPLAA